MIGGREAEQPYRRDYTGGTSEEKLQHVNGEKTLVESVRDADSG
jgi:hypothetical protein